MNQKMMEINYAEFKELKRKCSGAKKGEIFIFKGGELLKEYGDYLVEYLESKFEKVT